METWVEIFAGISLIAGLIALVVVVIKNMYSKKKNNISLM